MLGEARLGWPTTLARKTNSDSSGNALFNCSFFGAGSHPLVNSAGSGVSFENNLGQKLRAQQAAPLAVRVARDAARGGGASKLLGGVEFHAGPTSSCSSLDLPVICA